MSVSNKNAKDLINVIFWLETFSILLCVVTLSGILFLRLDLVIAFMNYLQPSHLETQFVNFSIITHLSEIIILMGFFGFFLYFFSLIKSSGFWIGEVGKDANKYLLIFDNLKTFFGGLIILIILIILWKIITPNNWIHVIITLLFLALILFAAFIFHKAYWSIIDKFEKISHFNNYLTTMPDTNRIIKKTVTSFFKENNSISGIILLLLFVYPVYGYVSDMNLLFIIFTELVIIYIHFLLSTVFFIPRKISEIVISSGGPIRGYIIYESSKGYLRILTENDEKLKLFYNQIVKISEKMPSSDIESKTVY